MRHNNNNKKDVGVWLSVFIMTLLPGCALIFGYGPDGQSAEEFRKRAEAAFRLQNQMTSEVMMLQDDGELGVKQPIFLQAEQTMRKNCAYLNQYAIKEIDNEKLGFLLINKVEDTIVQCEQSANNLKELLKNK